MIKVRCDNIDETFIEEFNFPIPYDSSDDEK